MCAYEREVCIYVIEGGEQLAGDDQFRWPARGKCRINFHRVATINFPPRRTDQLPTASRRSKREPSRELNGWFEHAFSPGLYHQPGLKDGVSPRHAAKTFGPGWYLKPGPMPLDLWPAVRIDGNGPSGRDH